jgi:hypothetical protein
MTGVDKKQIILTRMLIVMDTRSEEHGEEVEIVQLPLFHPVSPHDEVVHGLTHICCMGLVMVLNGFVPTLNL